MARSDMFLLDPEVAYLNHGSFGACPRAVFDVYQEWQRVLEREPIDLLERRLEKELARVRAALGEYIGAHAGDLALLPNATSALNTVLRSLPLRPGDAAPAAQAGGPDDRALYRGGDSALASTSQSPDDRALYRGSSAILAPVSVSPDDRPFLRSATEIEPGSPRIQTIASATGFDWADAAIGSTFGAALALLAGGAALVANQRRRSLRSA